jgi:RNA ligase (TIGR02306 family)
MHTNLATIQVISAIEPHPNADKLEIAKVLGWQSVVKKGEFKQGQPIVFIVIDTILPHASWSSFLADKDISNKPIRLKTVRLRNVFSQGLVLPTSVLPIGGYQVGDDVTIEMGIKKYEKEIPASLAGEVAGPFPPFVPKTDEVNGLSHPDIVAETIKHPLSVTQKLDGSSCTIVIQGGEIIEVCSRNLSLKENAGNAFWKAARKLTLLGLRNDLYDNAILQGEVMGPGIQGNQLGLKEPEFFLYTVWVENGGRYSHSNPRELPAQASCFNCKPVPRIELNGAEDFSKIILDPVGFFTKLADEQKIRGTNEAAEGIVVRACHDDGNKDSSETLNPSALSGRPLGFKIINRNYKD